MKPYQDLVDAIILQAVRDYRLAIRGICIDRNIPINDTIDEIEDFFKSEWYSILSKVDGTYLLKKLKEEYKDECRTHTANPRAYKYHHKSSINLL